MNPYRIGDEAAHLTLDASGLRSTKVTIHQTDGQRVGVSVLGTDHTPAQLDWFTVDDLGEAVDLVPMDEELAEMLAETGTVITPLSQKASESEARGLDILIRIDEALEEQERLSQERGEGHGNHF